MSERTLARNEIEASFKESLVEFLEGETEHPIGNAPVCLRIDGDDPLSISASKDDGIISAGAVENLPSERIELCFPSYKACSKALLHWGGMQRLFKQGEIQGVGDHAALLRLSSILVSKVRSQKSLGEQG